MWCNQISWQRYNKWEKKSLLPWCHFRPWSSQRSSPSQASSGVHRLCREVFGLWPFSGREKKDAYNFMKNVSASMRTELTSQPKRREQDSHYTLKLTVFDYIQTSHCNKDIVNLKRNYSEGLKPNYCIFNVSSLIINTITLQNKPIMPNPSNLLRTTYLQHKTDTAHMSVPRYTQRRQFSQDTFMTVFTSRWLLIHIPLGLKLAWNAVKSETE